MEPRAGFVYILTSVACPYIKIGGSKHASSTRLKGVNSMNSYRQHGVWEVFDFLHVHDWCTAERRLHQGFKAKRIVGESARELFDVLPLDAQKALRGIPLDLQVGREKLERFRQNRALKTYLNEIFLVSGMYGHLDLQGSWTLKLFPKTAGGRYFTLNIGSHEVAFSAPKGRGSIVRHCFAMDPLARDIPEIKRWLKAHFGGFSRSPYKTARDRSISVYFDGDFADAQRFLQVRGVRRALVAYWAESLAALQGRKSGSSYARYHDYNVVMDLVDYWRAYLPLSEQT